jgi:adenine-specific DNA methylase
MEKFLQKHKDDIIKLRLKQMGEVECFLLAYSVYRTGKRR